MLFRCS